MSELTWNLSGPYAHVQVHKCRGPFSGFSTIDKWGPKSPALCRVCACAIQTYAIELILPVQTLTTRASLPPAVVDAQLHFIPARQKKKKHAPAVTCAPPGVAPGGAPHYLRNTGLVKLINADIEKQCTLGKGFMGSFYVILMAPLTQIRLRSSK